MILDGFQVDVRNAPEFRRRLGVEKQAFELPAHEHGFDDLPVVLERFMDHVVMTRTRQIVRLNGGEPVYAALDDV